MKNQKREPNGQYSHHGQLERLCVCGHTFGQHCDGRPADCLAYSFADADEKAKACRCVKFRPVRIK